MVAFTGAGISAESGIPTYRGDDGLWNKYDPAKFANINHFHKDPAYYWNFFKEVRYPVIRKARPNRAHAATSSTPRRQAGSGRTWSQQSHGVRVCGPARPPR
jgi:NAD-dependent deacetylase